MLMTKINQTRRRGGRVPRSVDGHNPIISSGVRGALLRLRWVPLAPLACFFAFVGGLNAGNNDFGVTVNGRCEKDTSCPPVPLPYNTANTLAVTFTHTLSNGDKYQISGLAWGSSNSNGGYLPGSTLFQVTYEGNATGGASAADTVTVEWPWGAQTGYGYGYFGYNLTGAFSPDIAASSSATGCLNGTPNCQGPFTPPGSFNNGTETYTLDASGGAFTFEPSWTCNFGAGSPVGSSVVFGYSQTALPPTIAGLSASAGKAGASVTITGTSLENALEVTFDGVNSSFTVVSDTEIIAAVPPGATTGPVQVRTVGGLAKAEGHFKVDPPTKSGSVTVNAVAQISGGGYGFPNTEDDTGILPPGIALPAGATYLTFSITGGSLLNLPGYGTPCSAPCITVNDDNGTGNYNDADGVGSGSSLTMTSYSSSLSGIVAPNAGFVTGVFESGGMPSGSAPPTLDFTSFGTDFLTLSPQLNQLFFIGDGLTGDGTGSVQRFYVPAGATVLYLGIPDACNYNSTPSCYGDNVGDFVVSYKVATTGSGTEQ